MRDDPSGDAPSRRTLAVVTAVLVVVGLPLELEDTRAWLDPSWMAALSLVHVQGIRFGPDFVFTYGPYGFLATPQEFFFRGVLAAVVYAVVTAAAVYAALLRATYRWLPPSGAVAVTTVFALFAPMIAAPELGVIALFLVAFELLRPSTASLPLPRTVPVVLGAVAALQLQVKFGVGVSCIVITAIVTLSRPGRRAAVALASGSWLVTTLVLWVVAGQRIGDLATWVRRSMLITSGYNDSMALNPGGIDRYSWLMLAPPLGLVVMRVARDLRRERWRHLPPAALVAWTTWYFVKQGYVRLDYSHREFTMTALAAVILALGWRRWARVALPVAAFALITVPVIPGTDWRDAVDDLVDERTNAGLVIRTGRMAVDSEYRRSRVAAQRAFVLGQYGLRPDSLEGLDGTVHGDPHEVSAPWALQREWQPMPAFQMYLAYDPELDDANAAALRGPDAPDVIMHVGGSLDHRVPVWESPEHQLTMTCNYDLVRPDGFWRMLRRRADDRCGAPELIEEQVVGAGEALVVPAPRVPTSIVVAEFDYPTTLANRVATVLLRPLALPTVDVDGLEQRFLPSVDGQLHLVRVPLDDRGVGLPWGGTAMRTIRFLNPPGDVVARFYEIPLG